MPFYGYNQRGATLEFAHVGKWEFNGKQVAFLHARNKPVFICTIYEKRNRAVTQQKLLISLQ